MTEKLRVVTLNIHKGLSQFNRRMVIHELREGLGALKPDVVFLQEVAGLNQRHAQRFAAWPGKGQHEFLAGEELQHVYGRNRVHQYGHYGNAVLSRFPIEAGIPPAFEVLDDQSARELIGAARQRVLERAGSGDAELQNAVSLLVVVLIPKERQAISSSRSASQARPIGNRRSLMVTKAVSKASSTIR